MDKPKIKAEWRPRSDMGVKPGYADDKKCASSRTLPAKGSTSSWRAIGAAMSAIPIPAMIARPEFNYSGKAFKTADDTNHSRDHIGSGADLHHFSGVDSKFRGMRGYR